MEFVLLCVFLALNTLFRHQLISGASLQRHVVHEISSSSNVAIAERTETSRGKRKPALTVPQRRPRHCPAPPLPLRPTPKPFFTEEPLVDFLCGGCRGVYVNWREDEAHLYQPIVARPFLLEKGCLVRMVRPAAAASSSSGTAGGTDQILLTSFAQSAGELQRAARKQAEKFVELMSGSSSRGPANASSRPPPPPKPPPDAPTPVRDHPYPGLILNLTLMYEPRSPQLLVGAGVWDPASAQLTGPGTPYATGALGLPGFRKSESARPTIIVNMRFFGHFFHTMADLIMPLFLTLRFLRWDSSSQGVDVWLWSVNGVGNDKGPWAYWESVVLEYQKMASELGLHISLKKRAWRFGADGFPEFVGNGGPGRRQLVRSVEADSASPPPQDPADRDLVGRKILGPEIPFGIGRWCVSPERGDGPVLFGALQEAGLCFYWKGTADYCRRGDPWRPGVAAAWQLANEIFWRNSVEVAHELLVPAEFADTSRAGGRNVSSRNVFPLLLERFSHTLSSTTAPARSTYEDPAGDTTTGASEDVLVRHALFLTRHSGKRLHTNQHEVQQVFQANFATSFAKDLNLQVHFVELEKLSLQQQRALISQTSLLIGVHGAGLTAQWWLPPGAQVVEIDCDKCDYPLGLAETRKPPKFYPHAAAVLQQPFLHYIQTRGEFSVNTKLGDFLQPEFTNPNHFWTTVKKFWERRQGCDAKSSSTSAGGLGAGAALSSEKRKSFATRTSTAEQGTTVDKIVGGSENKEENLPTPRPFAPEICFSTDEPGSEMTCFPPTGYRTPTDRSLDDWTEAGSSPAEKQAVIDYLDRLSQR